MVDYGNLEFIEFFFLVILNRLSNKFNKDVLQTSKKFFFNLLLSEFGVILSNKNIMIKMVMVTRFHKVLKRDLSRLN